MSRNGGVPAPGGVRTGRPPERRRPRLPLVVLATFWTLTGGTVSSLGLGGPATAAIFLGVALALPAALVRRPDGLARRLEPVNPRRSPVPLPLWAFAGWAAASAVHQRTDPGTQNALVYLAFVGLIALAATWTSAGSGLLLLRLMRAAAVVAAVAYLITVARHGAGNSVLFPKRIFGEAIWVGMVAAVPLAGRSRWGWLAPLILLAADFLSLSRTSAAVCAVLLLGLVVKGRGRGELRRAALLAAVTGLAALLLVTQYEPLRDRFVYNDSHTVAGLAVGTSGRAELWATTWAAIRQAPWTGHGIGSVELLLADPGLGHPHNDYLRLWHDFGALGLALWVAAVLLLVRGALRRRRAARGRDDWAIHQAALLALVGLSLNVLTSNLLVYVFVMVPIAVVVGTSLGAAGPSRGQRHPNHPPGTKGSTVDLRAFAKAVARRWLSITLLALVGLGCGLGVAALSVPQYEAASQIFVSTRATGDIAELNQGSAFSQARVQSYAEIIPSPTIAKAVADRLGLDLDPAALAHRITATAKPNTVLIDITVTDVRAARAAQLANAVAAEAGRQIVALETPPGQNAAAPVHIGITRTAADPSGPVSPRPLLDAGAGLFAGLLAGVGLALLRDALDTTLRTAEALAGTAGLPVLGSVPFDKHAREDALAVTHAAHGARAEAYRVVRTNLQFAQVDRRPRIILVTSSLAGEGKTNTAANLALSLAETGRRTCLVDADLRSPSVARAFGLVQDAGLTSVLIGAAGFADVMQQAGDGTLSVLTSGPMPPNPAELLASDRMRQVLEELADTYDTVVVDSAPLLPVADTVGLSALVDGAVLVVRAGRTPAERVQAGVGALRSAGTPVLGGVLSMAQLERQGYGYGYGHEVRPGTPATAEVPGPATGESAAASRWAG
ncbi:polysaccharide biosynthesis tyrosine autokinase [Kitasatospora sp. NPDC059571]|uniref:polysaccharide biosynthesis tyrosine autokinase n=1 Tax=Kitasatospora sp. NPDC059571 TaxID=3346871 RepID=UPI0036BFCFF4